MSANDLVNSGPIAVATPVFGSNRAPEVFLVGSHRPMIFGRSGVPMRPLFPYIASFWRLHLQQRWWHRLFVVLFFGTLLASLLWVWIGQNRGELESYGACLEGETAREAQE